MSPSRHLVPLLAALALAAPALAQEPAGKARSAAQQPGGKAPAAPAAAPDGRETLLHAYQKEYAFLTAEEVALADRLAEVERDQAARLSTGRQELAAAEERLRALRLELEAERARLAGLEAKGVTDDDGAAAVDAVLSQARAVLPASGVAATTSAATTSAATTSAVDGALTDVLLLLRARSTIRRAPGTFFLLDGSQARGDVVHVGAIGFLGASPEAAGALAPAGANELQLWRRGDEAPARAAATGALPPVLPLYLFESLEKPAQRQLEGDAADTVRRGGLVAYVIVYLGGLALLIALVRAALLLRASGDPDRLVDAVGPLLAAGRQTDALALAAHARGAAARLVHALIPYAATGDARLESVASERLLHEQLGVERFETALTVSAAVAPLLGLLGTVTGMITTFDVITVFGTGDPKLLAGGISEALITTELGLVVAIPALLAGNLLNGWAERVRTGMERAILRMTLVERPAPASTPTAEVAPERRRSGATSARLPVGA